MSQHPAWVCVGGLDPKNILFRNWLPICCQGDVLHLLCPGLPLWQQQCPGLMNFCCFTFGKGEVEKLPCRFFFVFKQKIDISSPKIQTAHDLCCLAQVLASNSFGVFGKSGNQSTKKKNVTKTIARFELR